MTLNPSTSISSGSNATSIPLSVYYPPPGTNWLATIDVSIPFLLIGSTLGAVLVTLLAALLFFSTPAVRCTPVFVLNLVAVILGIAQAALNLEDEIHTLKYPTIPIARSIDVALGAFSGYLPILVDCILLIRLYAVYPPSQTSRKKFIAVMTMPILLKVARFINTTIYITNFSNHARSLISTATAAGGSPLLTSSLPSVKIQWFLEVFDDLASSGLFLFRIWESGNPFDRDRTISQKIRTLFWIAASNFVLPVILGVIQITIFMATPKRYLIALYVEQVNLEVTIVGVVFATVWVAERRWWLANNLSENSTTQIDSGPLRGYKEKVGDGIVFAPRPVGESFTASELDTSLSTV